MSGETTELYNVTLYTSEGNDHFLQFDVATLARLESDLASDKAQNFAQYYCQDDKSVVGVRLDAVELYTVKEVAE